MENWIETIIEPKKLYLAWQAPDHLKNRFRWAVGVLSTGAAGSLSLRYFRPGQEFAALNQDKSYDDLLALGFSGYPAFGLKHEVHEVGVAEAFLRRLPPRSRPDFESYMRQFRLPASARLTTASLLGYTEAKLPSDGFSIVDPLDASSTLYDLMLEVAGYRYYAVEAGPLEIGQPVQVAPEPNNPHDPGAVRFSINDRTIGYVNRLQAPRFQRWLRTASVHAVVERVNGRPERPRAFVFVTIRPGSRMAAA